MKALPHHQVASDPFPAISAAPSFDDWYSTLTTGDSLNADIPPAVSVEAPNAGDPLDIEIYNFPPSENFKVTPVSDFGEFQYMPALQQQMITLVSLHQSAQLRPVLKRPQSLQKVIQVNTSARQIHHRGLTSASLSPSHRSKVSSLDFKVHFS